MEVYNESVYDLLIPPSEGHTKLQLHKRGKEVIVPVSLNPSFLRQYHSFKILQFSFNLPPTPHSPSPSPSQGLTEVEVASIDDVLMVMREGENNRTVASTKMNTNR